jgi:hypothetical protein
MKIDFSWAVNKPKMERAIAEVRGDNPITNEVGTQEVTESAVKAVYVRLHGLVVEPDTTPVVLDEPVTEDTAPIEAVVKPRRTRKTK